MQLESMILIAAAVTETTANIMVEDSSIRCSKKFIKQLVKKELLSFCKRWEKVLFGLRERQELIDLLVKARKLMESCTNLN